MTAPGGTTTIGYAALALIPSLDGFSAAVDKQLGGTLKVVGQRGGKSMGAGLAAGLKASEADVKRALDNHAKLADKAADATGRLKVAQAGYDELVEKGVTSGKRYAAAVAAKERAARDEARAIKTATAALKEYEDAAKSAGDKASTGILSSLRGVASGAGSAGSEAAAGFAEGFAGSAALLRLGSVGGPVGIAVAAAGTVIGGLLWKNIEAGIDREPGRDLIQARLGANGAEIANLAKASGAAYANNFGESLQSNLQASQLAIQGGLVANAMDPALQSTTEKLQAISQLVGGDLSETVKSVSILLKSGMAQSADDAFDIIAKGYQVTGDLGADWLDSIGEYSSGWKNAGFTAEQALALIKQAQDNGVDVTDRSADALREFGRRVSEEGPKMVAILDAIGFNGQQMYDKFKEGGPAAFNAFDQVFDKIRSIQDPVDRNQVALALLGDTAGDFIDAFAKWDPSAAVTSLGSIEGAAQNASDTMGGNVVGSFEGARRSIEVAVDGVQDKLAEAFGPALTEVANLVKAHTDDITGFFVSMSKIGINVGSSILETVGEIAEAMGQLAGGIGNVQGTVLKFEAWQAEIRGDNELAKDLRKQSEEAYGWGDSLEAAGTSMRNSARDMKTWGDKLNDLTTQTGNADTAVGGLGTKVQGLGDAFRNMPTNLPGWFPNVAGGGAPSGPGWFSGFVPGSNGLPPTALPPGSVPSLDDIAATGGGGSGVGINLQVNGAAQQGPYGLPNGTDIRQGAAGFPSWVYDVAKSFGLQASTYSGHQEDKGQGNQGIDWWGPVENRQRFAEWLAQNRNIPGLEDVIFENPNTGQDIGVNNGRLVGTPGSDDPGYFRRGHNDFADHADHVHTTQSAPIPLPNGVPTPAAVAATSASALSFDWDAVAKAESSSNWANNDTGGNGHFGGLQFSPDTWKAFGGVELTGKTNPADATREQQIEIANRTAFTGFNGTAPQGLGAWEAITKGMVPGVTVDSKPTSGTPGTSPLLNNAYGVGYKPGIGTPGVNEYGDPGYYETDPRRIAQAQRSADDAVDRIAEADQAIADSNKDLADAVKERDNIAKLSEVQRIAQGKDLDKANADVDRLQKQVDRATKEASRSREDADWAQQDLAEAQQGSFKAAQKAGGGKSGGGGKGLSLSSTFSGFGSALGEFAGGQIGSALDVFGIGDSPPFLQAAQQFLGGISVSDAAGNSLFDGGNMFGGASPLSAAGVGGAAVADGTQHGSLGGQAPGPVFNTTIQARDAEGAMDQWRREQARLIATKTSVY